MFTPGGTTHAVMKMSAKVRHFLEELGKGCGVVSHMKLLAGFSIVYRTPKA